MQQLGRQHAYDQGNLLSYHVYAGVAAVCPELAGGERGGEEENGGEYSTTVAAGGGSDWGHTERPAEGD